MNGGPERVGVLVIRIWVEGEAGPRARITASMDVAQARQTTVMASSVDEACELVRAWLTRFVAGDQGVDVRETPR
jgi:hypothetical protein